MFTKIYVKIKEFISKNYLTILCFIGAIFISFYEFPYYISAPGGVIDISSRIEIDSSYNAKGSFNMAYVSEYKATLPMLLLANIKKDWDIEKKSDVLSSNETDKDAYIRDHLMLQEANQNAIIYAYNKAGADVLIKKSSIYVIYVYDEANTNLKIGDEIISINGINISTKEDITFILNDLSVGDNLSILVKNNGETIERFAKVIEESGIKLIGIMPSIIREYECNPNIKLKFKSSESGPSGGLMMSLAIYNYLTEEDITKGNKIAGTGTIDENGNVGSIGGIEYKIKGAVHDKIKYFIVPNGENYEDALKIKEENNYDINIVGVSTFDEALEALSKF